MEVRRAPTQDVKHGLWSLAVTEADTVPGKTKREQIKKKLAVTGDQPECFRRSLSMRP